MSEVKANRVAGWDDLKNPGDFCLLENSEGKIVRFGFCCPCGNCGTKLLSQISIDSNTDPGRPKWTWDGNKESPTLTPSILRRIEIAAHGDHPAYKCNWHGFLTNGIFRSC